MKRALLPAVLLGLVMSAIFVLPDFEQVESALSLEIPEEMGLWRTKTYPPSPEELKLLAGDTRFAKALCIAPRIEEVSYITGETPRDRIDLSVVLSGHDLANSIHRPERCMPAQGHRILRSEKARLELKDGRRIPAMRLISKQTLEVGPPGESRPVTFDALTYYFFVGAESITASHTDRTLIDIRDRVLGGQAQRWAYVSASTIFSDDPKSRFGGLPDLELADKKVRQLLVELADENVDWSRVP